MGRLKATIPDGYIPNRYLTNFKTYHRNNPNVFAKIAEYADRARQTRKKYSIEIIINVVRFWTDLNGVGDPFKINNNYKAYYARMYMQYRNCKGFFEERSSISDDYDFSYDIEKFKTYIGEN
tara:strand:- start:326 stop:691 length:366 start_codon:yes stop_codon:yes gene_type:complete